MRNQAISPVTLVHSDEPESGCDNCVLLSDRTKMWEYWRIVAGDSFKSEASYCYNKDITYSGKCWKTKRYPARLVHKLTGVPYE